MLIALLIQVELCHTSSMLCVPFSIPVFNTSITISNFCFELRMKGLYYPLLVCRCWMVDIFKVRLAIELKCWDSVQRGLSPRGFRWPDSNAFVWNTFWCSWCISCRCMVHGDGQPWRYDQTCFSLCSFEELGEYFGPSYYIINIIFKYYRYVTRATAAVSHLHLKVIRALTSRSSPLRCWGKRLIDCPSQGLSYYT